MTVERPTAYAIELSDRAVAALRNVDRPAAQRIVDRLSRLAEDPASASHVALSGELRGLFRLRVGDYRVIYALDHARRVVRVALVGHRRDIYDV